MDDKLSSLLSRYRDACPDPEPSANFTPQLWSRIEAQRGAALSSLLRRWTEAWLIATVAVALVISLLLIPRLEEPPVYQLTYVDVLSAADSAADANILPRAEAE